MNTELRDKIENINLAEPFIWRLRLSETDFNELKSAVIAVERTELLTKKWAKVVIAYMAEWYKRKYKGGTNHDALNLSSSELEAIWKKSGFNIERLVYCDSSGNHRWQYSTYVLGGLAIRHELGRNDKRKFLKALCRLYHHENYTLENLDSEERAISFRESIQREHSLYYYLQAILSGNIPFSEDDFKDSSSEVSRFLFQIKSANEEVMRKKFRLEWIVTNIPENSIFSRKLRVWLKPEEVGEGQHNYLSFDRVLLWGFNEPVKMNHLHIGIRFLCDDEIVEPIDWNNPLIKFINTGDTTGFVTADNISEKIDCRSLPSKKFNKLQILAKNEDDSIEKLVQEEDCSDYIQVWRVSPGDYKWSSRQNAQHETALLFFGLWHMELESSSEVIETRPFKDKITGFSLPWHWYYIYDKATINDNNGKSITFYNRQGYYQTTTKRYNNIIKYEDGGFVDFYVQDDDEMIPMPLPLIFKKEDIIVRHFNTKDDIINAQVDEDYDVERIEYKDGHKYIPWTDNSLQPKFGEVTLRITIQGRYEELTVCYLPAISIDEPIVRDYANSRILYKKYSEDGLIEDAIYQDNIPRNNHPLNSTISLCIGTEDGYANIKVWRPTLIKEIIMDGELIQYMEDGQEFDLPYIFKNRISINDFSREGFRNYYCGNLCNIFSEFFLNISGNPNVGTAALVAWDRGDRYPAQQLDSCAPNFLFVVFGNNKKDELSDECRLLFWNYDAKMNPKVVDKRDYNKSEEWGIIFQDLSQNSGLLCYYPKINDNDIWEWDESSTSRFKCFEVATQCGIYYFEMMPLRELSLNDCVKEIYEPLVEVRNGQITERDRDDLRRFAEEAGFDWLDLNINIDKE